MTPYMKETGTRLTRVTNGCRVDMHEPDEQGVTAIVRGTGFDNAMGTTRKQTATNLRSVCTVTAGRTQANGSILRPLLRWHVWPWCSRM